MTATLTEIGMAPLCVYPGDGGLRFEQDPRLPDDSDLKQRSNNDSSESTRRGVTEGEMHRD